MIIGSNRTYWAKVRRPTFSSLAPPQLRTLGDPYFEVWVVLRSWHVEIWDSQPQNTSGVYREQEQKTASAIFSTFAELDCTTHGNTSFLDVRTIGFFSCNLLRLYRDSLNVNFIVPLHDTFVRTIWLLKAENRLLGRCSGSEESGTCRTLARKVSYSDGGLVDAVLYGETRRTEVDFERNKFATRRRPSETEAILSYPHQVQKDAQAHKLNRLHF